MRQPPQSSIYLQQSQAVNGLYFTLQDQYARTLATSRVFCNQAWYAVGCDLLMDVPDAPQETLDYTSLRSNRHPRGFFGILIRPTENDMGYQFEYITKAGKTLLTSETFASRLEAEEAADRLRKIVREIGAGN